MKKFIYILFLVGLIFSVSCRRSSAGSGRQISEKKEIIDKEDNDRGRSRSRKVRSEKASRPEEKENSDAKVIVVPESTERRYTIWSINPSDNLNMLNEACDYTSPKTKTFANKLVSEIKDYTGKFNIKQICAIFDFCRSKWTYVNDPKAKEYLANASESIIGNLSGDCDDFAVLVASCMLAIGGDATVVTAQGPQGGHAYAEVDVSEMDIKEVKKYIKNKFSNYNVEAITIREDGQYRWLNLDWQAKYPGGPTFKANERVFYRCINSNWSFTQE